MGLSRSIKQKIRIRNDVQELADFYLYFSLLQELVPFYQGTLSEQVITEHSNPALFKALKTRLGKLDSSLENLQSIDYTVAVNLYQLSKKFGKRLGITEKDYLRPIARGQSEYLINPTDYKAITEFMLDKTRVAMRTYTMTTNQKARGAIMLAAVASQIVLLSMKAAPDSFVIPAAIIIAVSMLGLTHLANEYNQCKATMEATARHEIKRVNAELALLRTDALLDDKNPRKIAEDMRDQAQALTDSATGSLSIIAAGKRGNLNKATGGMVVAGVSETTTSKFKVK